MNKKIIIFCIFIIILEIIFGIVNKLIKLPLKTEPLYGYSAPVGSFQLAWNELSEKVVKEKIILNDDENNSFVNTLNSSNFTKEMLSEEDYYIKVGKTSEKLKQEIIKDVNKKFSINIEDELNQIDFSDENNNGYTVYSILKKECSFKNAFDLIKEDTFGEDTKLVNYFGIDENSDSKLRENLEIAFNEKNGEYAIKLFTKEGDIIYLYRTDESGTVEELYNRMKYNEKQYEGIKSFSSNDKLLIPKINMNAFISYDELCGKYINDTGSYIKQALQYISFSLNESEAKVESQAMIGDVWLSQSQNYYFNNRFVIFMTEDESYLPYFSEIIEDSTFLE